MKVNYPLKHILFDILELAYFLSGKKVVATPAIPMMVNTTDHLKLKSEEHRQIIDEYAKKGYRYVGYIPTVISDYGKIKDMDLVFEMDV